MYLRVLQRGRYAVGPDEMFFRNEQTSACGRFPLQRLLELLRRAIEFDGDRRLRSCFRRSCWRSDKAIVELDGAPPNRQAGNEKEGGGSHQHRAIVIRLKPVDCFCHDQRKRTTDNIDCTDMTNQTRRLGWLHSSLC